MPRIVAALRVKNEERWIERCLLSVAFCDAIVVWDDHSTDRTPEIALAFSRVEWLPSPFQGLDEVRDKNALLRHVLAAHRPDWIVCPDGDEELSATAQNEVVAAAAAGRCEALEFRVIYFWNDLRTMRADGVYGRFFTPRAYRVLPSEPDFHGRNGGGFHCGSVPMRKERKARRVEALIYHYGYVDAAQRASKFAFYRQHDPSNALEDNYRHITQGDPGGEPATARLKHAGPLLLVPATEFACAQAR